MQLARHIQLIEKYEFENCKLRFKLSSNTKISQRGYYRSTYTLIKKIILAVKI